MNVEMRLTYEEIKELIARHFAVAKDDVHLTDTSGNPNLYCWVEVEGEVDELANFGTEDV